MLFCTPLDDPASKQKAEQQVNSRCSGACSSLLCNRRRVSNLSALTRKVRHAHRDHGQSKWGANPHDAWVPSPVAKPLGVLAGASESELQPLRNVSEADTLPDTE